MLREEWTDAFLTEQRRFGDPLGDEAVAQLFERGPRAVDDLSQLITKLQNDETVDVEESFPELAELFAASATLPDWADPKKVERAQTLFNDHAVLAALSLVVASLPECYVLHKGAKILTLTDQLSQHFDRRLHQTALMVFPVMDDGGLEPGGRGILRAQLVRLIHAAVRHMILTALDGEASAGETAARRRAERVKKALVERSWNLEEDGFPINQEDMAYTLTTFSYVILRSLERILGVAFADEDRDAYVHVWNVVGHLIGVKAALLPDGFAEAEELFTRIGTLEAGESAAGHELTGAIIRFLDGLVPHGLRWIPPMAISFLVGSRTAEILRVRGHFSFAQRLAGGSALGIIRAVDGPLTLLNEQWRFSRRIHAWLGQRLVAALADVTWDGQRVPLKIPDHLRPTLKDLRAA